jgi:Ni/Fe-hydrogenase subunit HybB-like protein
MAIDTRAQLNGAGYSAATVTKAPSWHGLVAWDLLFNNLTTGLFLVAATAELTAPEVFTAVAKAAYPLALVLLVTDLACLVLDLGDPLRFHHMLRVFKPTSPMSLGTWSLTIYSLPLTVAAALSVLPAGWPALDWVRKAAVVLGVLPALGSALYKGVLLSTNSQPGWRDARWLGGYLTNSALVLGCAQMLLLAALLGQERASALLRPSLVLLLVLNLFPLGLVIRNLLPTLSRLYTPGQFGRLGALCLGLGTLAPLALLFAGGSLPCVLAGVLSLLVGSLALRFVIVRLPHAFS